MLGWLVAAGADQVGDDIGPSVRWLGRVAIWAMELTAHGAMVPLLRQRKRSSGSARESNGSYSVRWTPALMDATRGSRVWPRACPASCARSIPSIDARALIRSALTGMVDAICRDSARRLELPAPPPRVRTVADVSEAVIARLDGSAFDAPVRIAGEIATRVEQWARSVTGERERSCASIRPTPATRGTSPCSRRGRRASSRRSSTRSSNAGSGRARLEDETARLERMLPALARPGGTRRGQVILSQDEAWELMTVTGPQLVAAGFDVRVPALSRRKPSPSLRVFVDESSESVVGANQLANVRWSAVFDGVELTAADIARLAKGSAPAHPLR